MLYKLASKTHQNQLRIQVFSGNSIYLHTAVGLRKTSLLHKQIKNRATLANKNSVRKCYQGLFFIANMQFNNPTSIPQT